MVSRARSRVLQELYPGQIVYYFRRGKKKEDRGYRGPAKVIAIVKGQGDAPIVAWLSHGGTLIRAAPEHLRMATPLETRSLDILADMGNVTADMPGQRYIDLGDTPTAAEERSAPDHRLHRIHPHGRHL